MVMSTENKPINDDGNPKVSSSSPSSPSSLSWILSALRNPATLFAVFILVIIIVAGAILFMVLVGMIKIEDPVQKAAWVEISSQVLNACFTLNAILVLPARFQLTKWTTRWFSAKSKAQSSLQHHFASLIYESMPSIQLEGLHSMESTDSANTIMNSAKTAGSDGMNSTDNAKEEISPNNHSIIREVQEQSGKNPSARPTDTTPTWKWVVILSMLHGQWLFQIPITIAMWMYATTPDSRPPYIIPLFLPLSFGTGAIAGIWPLLITHKVKKNKSMHPSDASTAKRRKHSIDSKGAVRHSIVPLTDSDMEVSSPPSVGQNVIVKVSSD